MDYLSYTTKVYQLVQRYSLVSVLLFDIEYRKLQALMNFRWGTDVQHLHTLFLQPQLSKKGRVSGQKNGRTDIKDRKDTPICCNFNSQKGCSFQNCGYRHVCLYLVALRSILPRPMLKKTRYRGQLLTGPSSGGLGDGAGK